MASLLYDSVQNNFGYQLQTLGKDSLNINGDDKLPVELLSEVKLFTKLRFACDKRKKKKDIISKLVEDYSVSM